MLWLWRWGLPPLDRGRSGGHRSYLRRVCRLKEEGRQHKCQRRNRKSRAVQSGIFLRSIPRFCCMLCSQNAERLACEGRSGLVGPESHGRGRLSEIIYWCHYRILWITHARHTFYISSVYKVNSLAYNTACSPPHTLAGWCIGLTVIEPRGMTLRLERPISRDTRVSF